MRRLSSLNLKIDHSGSDSVASMYNFAVCAIISWLREILFKRFVQQKLVGRSLSFFDWLYARSAVRMQ